MKDSITDSPLAVPPPELVSVPPGQYLMGGTDDDGDRTSDELPPHLVSIDHTLSIGRFAVTFEEFDLYCQDAGVTVPGSCGWGRGRQPVINVSWEDVQAYILWLNERFGLAGRPDRYRLPSEAEWEYACRAGTIGADQFEHDLNGIAPINCNQRIIVGEARLGRYTGRPLPVGTLPPNAWGLHEMQGNVWEWVEDCWHECYSGAPSNGKPWVDGGDPHIRVVRGGAWNSRLSHTRSASREGYQTDRRNFSIGFRLARMLLP